MSRLLLRLEKLHFRIEKFRVGLLGQQSS
jgi:hypothetical protein